MQLKYLSIVNFKVVYITSDISSCDERFIAVRLRPHSVKIVDHRLKCEDNDSVWVFLTINMDLIFFLYFFPSFFFVSEWKSFIICKKSFEPSSFALWRIHHLHRAFDSMTAKKNRIIFSFFHEHFELNYSSTFTIFWHVSLGGQIQQIFPNSLLFLHFFI